MCITISCFELFNIHHNDIINLIDLGGVIWDMAAGGGGSQEANVPGQKLAEFCAQLDDYTPTVSNITRPTSYLVATALVF